MSAWTRCGTCGAAARFIGSHVLRAHVAYASPFGDRTETHRDLIADALASERSARLTRPAWVARAIAGTLPVQER